MINRTSVVATSLLTSLSAWLTLSGCRGAGIIGDKHGDKEQAAPAPEDPAGCPLTTGEQWQNFLQTYADNDKWVATCEDAIPCDADYYKLVDTKIKSVLDRCTAFLAKDDKIAACTKNIRAFVPSWMRQHDKDSYGFTVDNATYLAAEVATDKPKGMMVPPPAIVAAIPDRAKVEEAARLNGWRYITHDSALAGTRTFIYIPDPAGRFDQWMLLNFVDGSTEVNVDTPMSFIGVQKTDADGHPLIANRLNFRDYTISKSSNGTFNVQAHPENNGKCYSCHPSGMRQLIARHTNVLEAMPVKGEADFDPAGKITPADFGFKRLTELNNIIRAYGLPDWDGKIIPENHGPALGKDQGCVGCHNGTKRGILTVSTSITQLGRKIYDQLSMPQEDGIIQLLERSEMKNPVLNDDEGNKLTAAFAAHDQIAADFMDSRQPVLRDWLLETACE